MVESRLAANDPDGRAKTYTRLTTKSPIFLGIRFIHLRLAAEKAFWATAAKSRFPCEFVWLLAACDAISFALCARVRRS